jgi:CRP/FNR family transcriptional regulator, dissimilatory nitrate respiration regulator
MPNDFAEIQRAALGTSLRRCHMFSELPIQDLQWIASFVVQKRLSRGNYLFRQGAPFEGFYVVQHGAINVHRVNASGKAQVIHVFRADESFAEAALAENTGYPADARALEQTSVLLVPTVAFLELLRKRPELALRMLGSMSRHLQTLVGLIDDLTLKNVQTRLVSWLLKRCGKPLGDKAAVVELGRTKSVLAAEFGTTNETLSRTFAELRKRKLISVKRGTITIPKPLDLEELFRRNVGDV